jgi:hypothetical protein
MESPVPAGEGAEEIDDADQGAGSQVPILAPPVCPDASSECVNGSSDPYRIRSSSAKMTMMDRMTFAYAASRLAASFGMPFWRSGSK